MVLIVQGYTCYILEIRDCLVTRVLKMLVVYVKGGLSMEEWGEGNLFPVGIENSLRKSE